MSTTIATQPANLNDVMAGDQSGYRLQLAYSLELTHELMGYFPAIITGTDCVIVTLDKELLEEVWRMLTPRRSRVNANLVYANPQDTLAFPLNTGEDLGKLLAGKPMAVLTRAELAELTASSENPFSWAPGLVANDMSPDEFTATLQAALEKL